jgi:lipopolysaccharide transport system permease protein
MIEAEDDNWDTEITPNNNLFRLGLKDVWHYRDLLVLLVRRDFVAFYKQTILGPLWFFIQPVITTITYTVIFGKLAGIPTDNIPPPLFYLAGITIWNYFADCLIKTSTVFKDNAAMLGKVYFPRLIMPLSIVFSNLIRFAVQFTLFLIILAFLSVRGYPIAPNATLLLFPLLILLVAAQGLGIGMIISAITTKYRDLAFVVSFGVPLLMYVVPIIYPLSVAEATYPDYAAVIKYNPITAILETFRYGFLGKGSFSWQLLSYSCVVTVILFLTGTIIFNRVEKNFVDTV